MHGMSRPTLSTVAEWLQPITRFRPMWALGCSVAACGEPQADRCSLQAVQLALLRRFLASPPERATRYSALGLNFFVIGRLVSAFALGAVANAA